GKRGALRALSRARSRSVTRLPKARAAQSRRASGRNDLGANMSNPPSLLHENARLPGSRFANVDLHDSVFENVNLAGASFDNVALAGARFHNVNLSQVAIEDANLEGTTINGVLVRDLFRAYEKEDTAE
ncbi:MAG TPA: pentapeptide repeat-containing protein, partial [Polyangiaceae bacterium]|nr:pentapeptide repeat-containing protein [Polyangiaceae bacterium]